MNFDKFTIKAQETIQEAVRIAEARRQQAIEPEHLLAAILKNGEQVASQSRVQRNWLPSRAMSLSPSNSFCSPS